MEKISMTRLGFNADHINQIITTDKQRPRKPLGNEEIDLINVIFGNAARITGITPNAIQTDRNPNARLARLLIVSVLSTHPNCIKRKWVLSAFLGQPNSVIAQLYREARNTGPKDYPKEFAEIRTIYLNYADASLALPQDITRENKTKKVPRRSVMVSPKNQFFVRFGEIKKELDSDEIKKGSDSDEIEISFLKIFAQKLLIHLNVNYLKSEIDFCCQKYYPDNGKRSGSKRRPTSNEYEIFSERLLLVLGQKQLITVGKRYAIDFYKKITALSG